MNDSLVEFSTDEDGDILARYVGGGLNLVMHGSTYGEALTRLGEVVSMAEEMKTHQHEEEAISSLNVRILALKERIAAGDNRKSLPSQLRALEKQRRKMLGIE